MMATNPLVALLTRRQVALRAGLAALVVLGLIASPGAADAARAKAILVSVGQQKLWAFKGQEIVLTSYVSTGKAGFETPLGTYSILSKLPSQTMAGVIGGETYNVPDVPWVMYFTTGGHALHGTYWHNNFGTPMSHGCVNLPMDVAAWLYDWAPVGTPVMLVP
jgi:lipoprotein-anchoring transpeptidase ErfK/SrfK